MSTAPVEATTTQPQVTVHIADSREKNHNHIAAIAGLNNNQRHTAFEEIIEIGASGLKLKCLLLKDHLFIAPEEDEWPWHFYGDRKENQEEPLAVAKPVGNAYTKVVKVNYHYYDLNAPQDRWGYNRGWKDRIVEQVDCFLPQHHTRNAYQFDPNDPRRMPYAYITLDITAFGQTIQKEMRFRLPTTGKVSIQTDEATGKSRLVITVTVLGLSHDITTAFDEDPDNNYYGDNTGPLAILYKHLKHSKVDQGEDGLWAVFLAQWMPAAPPMDGLSSIYKRKAIAPNLERLEKEAPVDWAFFRWLHHTASFEGRKNNQLLSAFLQKAGEDYDTLLKALRDARKAAPSKTSKWVEYRGSEKGQGFPAKRAICLELPGAADKVQEQDEKKDWRKRKTAEGQAEGLGVDAAKYPLLHAAISEGHLPTGIFNQPKSYGNQGQPVNREFALWEKALAQKGWAEVIYKVAQNASRRSTYERDMTPWLNALFKWPAYLTKHTHKGKAWRGIPKFVESSWELEMANEANDDNGKQKTQKERSAFTPWVDNEKRTLTIPYVAVAVSGVRTQWCYSQHYYLFEEGFTDPESGGIVVNEFEEKLNGRDDYGLCYFTLTGTDTARGYPTFLIILERRKGGKETFVHFHRVRPNRSKNGVKTPACELIEACYQYMAGNIPASDITNQQGDLIFLKYEGNPISAKAKVAEDAQSAPVMEFEAHRFVSANPDVSLTLHVSTAKTPKNRLGYLHAPSGLAVRHPEHEDIEHLDEGWYEIRRCKSYENNPVGIWSLTID